MSNETRCIYHENPSYDSTIEIAQFIDGKQDVAIFLYNDGEDTRVICSKEQAIAMANAILEELR